MRYSELHGAVKEAGPSRTNKVITPHSESLTKGRLKQTSQEAAAPSLADFPRKSTEDYASERTLYLICHYGAANRLAQIWEPTSLLSSFLRWLRLPARHKKQGLLLWGRF